MSITSKDQAKCRNTFATLALCSLALFACTDRDGPLPLEVGSVPTASLSTEFPTELASAAWQAHARTLIASHRTSPPSATRIYALVSIAQYGAVVDAVAASEVESAAEDPGFGPGGRSQFERERGAIAGASAQVLSFVYPDAAAALEQRIIDESNVGPGDVHPQFTRGVAIGRTMGNTMIAWAKADRFSAPWTGSIPVGPGMWIPNGPPAGPMIGSAQPYFMTSGSQFRPVPPPLFGSVTFQVALDEIKTLSLTRTAEQLALALSWNQSTGTATTLGFWNQLATQYSLEHGFDERATTHILALMDAAVLDAVIGCWDAKYFYTLIRPSQATTGITLPIGLPNHPSYPSGHSCVSSAAAAVIASFFPEHTAELNGMVTQAGLSRMYGGIHYGFDVSAGQSLGTAIAGLALAIDQADGLLSRVR